MSLNDQHNAHCETAEDAGYEIMADSCQAPVLFRYRNKPWSDDHEKAARDFHADHVRLFDGEAWEKTHPFRHVEARDWVLNRISSGLPINLA